MRVCMYRLRDSGWFSDMWLCVSQSFQEGTAIQTMCHSSGRIKEQFGMSWSDMIHYDST